MSCQQNTAGFSTPKAWSEPPRSTPRIWIQVSPTSAGSTPRAWVPSSEGSVTPNSWAPICAVEPLPVNTIYTFAGEPLILFRLAGSVATPITTF